MNTQGCALAISCRPPCAACPCPFNLSHHSIVLHCCQVLVLDEADRLLDMGFKKQLDTIMARLPK